MGPLGSEQIDYLKETKPAQLTLLSSRMTLTSRKTKITETADATQNVGIRLVVQKTMPPLLQLLSTNSFLATKKDWSRDGRLYL